jgi:hypothetical protein
MMNRSTTQRAEEARRQAETALQERKRAQNALLKERADAFAGEALKVDKLRALRLAKEAAATEATEIASATPVPATPRKRRSTKPRAGGDIDSDS